MTVIDQSIGADRVETLEELRHYYRGAQGSEVKLGAEVEYAIARQDNLGVPSWQQTQDLYHGLQSKNLLTGFEPPTSAIEVATHPYSKKNILQVFEAIDKGAQSLFELTKDNDLVLSPFGQWPHILAEDIQIVDTPRYQSFFAPPRDDMLDVARFFSQCMNIQVSIGYKNPDHLLKIVRMATVLEPVIFATLDSSCGYDQGKVIRHVQNIAQKNKMGVNTGVPDFYYTAKTGAEFVDAHINFSMNNKHMFTAFNYEGTIERLPRHQYFCFNDLETMGLGPQNLTNYLQGQSQSWRRVCNIATILDGDGKLANHRAELCASQNGLLHQRSSALLFAYLIGFDPEFYEDVQRTLLEFGIDLNDLQASKALLEANFDAACFHDNRYHEVAFGTRTMGEFVKILADHIEAGVNRCDGLAPRGDALLHIMRSGRPDWLVYREKMPDLGDCMQYLKGFNQRVNDDERFMGSNNCADQLL